MFESPGSFQRSIGIMERCSFLGRSFGRSNTPMRDVRRVTGFCLQNKRGGGRKLIIAAMILRILCPADAQCRIDTQPDLGYSSLVPVDVNNDGIVDLPAIGTNSIDWQYNSGGYTFVVARRSLVSFSQQPTAAIFFDVDRDSLVDIFVNLPSGLQLCRGLGPRTAFPTFAPCTSVASYSCAAKFGADVDGDGWVDLVGWSASTLCVLRNLGNLTFSLVTVATTLATITTVASCRFNSDAYRDFLWGFDSGLAGASTIGVLLSTASAAYANVALTLGAGTPINSMVLQCHDLDGDGFDEVIQSTKVSWKTTGNSAFANWGGIGGLNLGGQIFGFAVADLNGDGHLDIIGAPYYWPGLTWYMNMGSGASWQSRRFAADGDLSSTRVYYMFAAKASELSYGILTSGEYGNHIWVCELTMQSTPGFYTPVAAFLQPCTAGYYCPGGVTPIKCPAGNACPAKGAYPLGCPSGTYTASGQTTCLACASGLVSANATNSTVCIACPAGSMASSDGITCTPCACAAGFSSTMFGAQSCLGTSLTCSSCAAGHACAGGASQPVACSCSAGYASTTTTSVSCSGTNATCAPCPAGTFCAFGGAAQPLPCPAGTFGATSGISSAQCTGLCASGYVCAAGSFSQSAAPCGRGNYCPAGSSSAIPCPAGTFSSSPTLPSADCSGPCSSGYYCPAGSNVSTMEVCGALPGSYCPQGSPAAGGVACPAGSYCSGGAAQPVICRCVAHVAQAWDEFHYRQNSFSACVAVFCVPLVSTCWGVHSFGLSVCVCF